MSQLFSFSWRVLAHYTDGKQPHSLDINSAPSAKATRRWWKKAMPGKPYPKGDEGVLTRPCEFDELVIGDWFHLEQMDRRAYWMSIGGYHFWVHEEKGKAVVTHDGRKLSEYGLVGEKWN